MTELRQLLPPVQDQGERETCLSLSLSAGHYLTRGSDPFLSADYLHFHAAQYAGVSVNDAISVQAGLRALRQKGHPAESDCPYSESARDDSWVPPAPSGDLWRREARVTTLHSGNYWKNISAATAAKPAVLILHLDDAFWDPVSGVIEVSSGVVRGTHAVLALQVLEKPRRVLIRNSWGPDWGDGGHAWLSAKYLKERSVAVISFGKDVK